MGLLLLSRAGWVSGDPGKGELDRTRPRYPRWGKDSYRLSPYGNYFGPISVPY